MIATKRKSTNSDTTHKKVTEGNEENEKSLLAERDVELCRGSWWRLILMLVFGLSLSRVVTESTRLKSHVNVQTQINDRSLKLRGFSYLSMRFGERILVLQKVCSDSWEVIFPLQLKFRNSFSSFSWMKRSNRLCNLKFLTIQSSSLHFSPFNWFGSGIEKYTAREKYTQEETKNNILE